MKKKKKRSKTFYKIHFKAKSSSLIRMLMLNKVKLALQRLMQRSFLQSVIKETAQHLVNEFISSLVKG